MHNYTGCTFLPFSAVFSNEFSNEMHDMMQNYKCCICLAFTFVWFQMCHKIVYPRGFIFTLVAYVLPFSGVFLNESSNCLPEKMHIHTGCICLTFLQCVFSNTASNRLPEMRVMSPQKLLYPEMGTFAKSAQY